MAGRKPDGVARPRQSNRISTVPSAPKSATTVCPAEADSGIRFLRTDVVDRDPWIAARYDRVVDTRLCTVIGNDDGVRVGTI